MKKSERPALRSLRVWLVLALVMAAVHGVAMALLARWDVAGQLLARFPPHAGLMAAVVAAYVLRFMCFLLLPPLLAWKATRALVEALDARG